MKNITILLFRLILMTVLSFSLNQSFAQERLEIVGAVKLSNTTNLTPSAGTIQWTGSDFLGFDGTKWVPLTQLGVKDIDGNIYKTVIVGTQLWMAENLKTTRFANGNTITDGSAVGDISGFGDVNYWFAYDNDVTNIPIYGRLYTYQVAADGRNVCPAGWHVPTKADYMTLSDYLGGSTKSGGPLKLIGNGLWTGSNAGATNTSGMTMLPGGFRNPNGAFDDITEVGSFWTTTSDNANDAIRFAVTTFSDDGIINPNNKKTGYSIRCLKDTL